MKTRINNLFLLPALIASLGVYWQTAYSQNCDPPPPGLVAWWPGDGNTTDIVGGNNGFLENGATYTSGQVGQGFCFNGNNQFVQIADSSSLEPVSLTIECWINSSNYNYGAIVCKPVGGGSADSYALWLQPPYINGKICNANVEGPVVQQGFIPVSGFFYHVAYTFDDNSQIQALYVNALLVASNSVGGVHIGYDISPILIGADNDYGQIVLPFTGAIDEVTVYNRALSATEIAAIYNAGIAGKCQTPSLPANVPLTIVLSVNNVILTWPTNVNGFDTSSLNLLSTTNLNPMVWSPVSPGPVVINGQFTVTNSTSGSQMFYRLSE
jgi:hypothetical protein